MCLLRSCCFRCAHGCSPFWCDVIASFILDSWQGYALSACPCRLRLAAHGGLSFFLFSSPVFCRNIRNNATTPILCGFAGAQFVACCGYEAQHMDQRPEMNRELVALSSATWRIVLRHFLRKHRGCGVVAAIYGTDRKKNLNKSCLRFLFAVQVPGESVGKLFQFVALRSAYPSPNRIRMDLVLSQSLG